MRPKILFENILPINNNPPKNKGLLDRNKGSNK